MRVLIAGAGIAGLALAGFLKEQGLEPVIVEKAKVWSRVGYGIALWGNGIRILERLGLAEAFYAKGDRIDAWTLRNAYGQILKQADLHWEHLPPLTAIHRADLHGVLLDNVPQSWMRMATTVDSLRPTTEGVQVRLSDGSEELYDLVVGADGVRSQVRAIAFDNWQLEPAGTATWSFWLPETIDPPPGFTEAWMKGGKAFLVAPVAGRHMGSVAVPIDQHYAPDASFDFLKNQVQSDEWLLPEVLDALQRPEAIYHDQNYRVKAPQWHQGQVVLIGDAAHAMHPIVGMGASLALEDAYVLAAELNRVKPNQADDAVQRFGQRRKKRVTAFQRQAQLTKTFTFIESGWLRRGRDFAVRHTPFLEQFFQKQVRDVAENLFQN